MQTVVYPADLPREEWLKIRRGIITSTDVAAICGLSPYKSPMDVWCEKTGVTDPVEENEAMEWGRRLEEPIAQAYAQKNGVVLRPVGLIVGDGWIGCTADRLIEGVKRGLEVKTTGGHMEHAWGEEGTDQIPEYHLVQCAICMALTELPEWDVATLIGGQKFRTYKIKRNMALEGSLLKIARRFYDEHLVPRIPPDIDGSNGAAEYLKATYPSDSRPELLDTNPELDKMATELRDVRAIIENHEGRKAELENMIKAVIGDNAGIKGKWWHATWKKNKDGVKIDWEQVAKKLGAGPNHELVKQHTTTKEGARTFRFKVEG